MSLWIRLCNHTSIHTYRHQCTCGLVGLLVVLIVPLFLSFLAMPGLCCLLRVTPVHVSEGGCSQTRTYMRSATCGFMIIMHESAICMSRGRTGWGGLPRVNACLCRGGKGPASTSSRGHSLLKSRRLRRPLVSYQNRRIRVEGSSTVKPGAVVTSLCDDSTH